MKIITINVNGIRAAAKKGLFEWLQQQQADYICLQEVRANLEQLADSRFFPDGYYYQYNSAQKKGYSGVAIYAKQKPAKIHNNLGFSLCDEEGRFLAFEYEDFYIASLYFPSGSSSEHRQQQKYHFLAQIEPWLEGLASSTKPCILTGDFNIAHKNEDIRNWKGNLKNSGFLPEERAWLDWLFGKARFTDLFRTLKQPEHSYTWWSNRGKARENNVGWRIDYQIANPAFSAKLNKAWVYKEQWFSDHAPLIMEFS